MNKFNFIITVLSKVLEFLGKMKCKCFNSKCSSVKQQNEINVEKIEVQPPQNRLVSSV